MAWWTKSSSSAEKFASSSYGATVVPGIEEATVVGACGVVVGAGTVVVVATRGGSIFIPELMSTAQVLITHSRTCSAD
ncbi:MAG: hypothetical protein RL114_1543 [Actinomycetota bacterium]